MKLKQIRQALEFYANEENHLEETEGARLVYKSPVAEDRGNRARAALRALGEIEGFCVEQKTVTESIERLRESCAFSSEGERVEANADDLRRLISHVDFCETLLSKSLQDAKVTASESIEDLFDL